MMGIGDSQQVDSKVVANTGALVHNLERTFEQMDGFVTNA